VPNPTQLTTPQSHTICRPRQHRQRPASAVQNPPAWPRSPNAKPSIPYLVKPVDKGMIDAQPHADLCYPTQLKPTVLQLQVPHHAYEMYWVPNLAVKGSLFGTIE